MRRFNVLTDPLRSGANDPPGFRGDGHKIGEQLGAERLQGGVYELPPGERICPYHYELSDEEWLVVLAGSPTVRHPGGEDVLAPGDTVCFPVGPAGAHAVANAGPEPARVLIVSTRLLPAVAVYPDSGKVGVFTAAGAEDGMFRREDAVGYYEGEA